MTHWWRAYDDAIDNPKLLKLSDADHRAWFTLQCIASANGGVLPPAGDIAVRLRLKPTKVAAWITKMVQAKLIDHQDGVFVPHNWDTRQYKSDATDPTARQRMKRYREKKRNERNGDDRNDRNATVTDIRPEADTEADQSRADAAPPFDEGLKKRAFALSTSISLQFTSRGFPVPPGDRSVHWLQQGLNPGSILTAIEKVLKRGKPISSMEYFDGAIRDEHAKPPMPVSGTAEVVDLSRINWDATVKLWRGNQSIWPRGIGGEPGMATCKCPANVLADNLIDPATGRLISEPLHFVHEQTDEMAAWCHHSQIAGRKPPVVFEIEVDGVVRRGAYMPKPIPDGYDSTGERLPAGEEHAA